MSTDSAGPRRDRRLRAHAGTPACSSRSHRTYGIVAAELDAAVPVVAERDLVVSILGVPAGGVGGERFVASLRRPRRVRRPVRHPGDPGRHVRAGGDRDAPLGVPARAPGQHRRHVRRLLPAASSYVCSAVEDSTDPHLIVQYPAGPRCPRGRHRDRAPHPNRLIYVNDPPNRELGSPTSSTRCAGGARSS